MRSAVLSEIRRLITQPRGMLLCCGPPGSGWASTLYACLRDVDRHKTIFTIEDAIEYPLTNIIQKRIDTGHGQTFANTLPSILEQHPAVLMIGKIQDVETANIACKAASDRSLVFSGLEAIDTVVALFRILEIGVDPTLFASATLAISLSGTSARSARPVKNLTSPNRSFSLRPIFRWRRSTFSTGHPRIHDRPAQHAAGRGTSARLESSDFSAYRNRYAAFFVTIPL